MWNRINANTVHLLYLSISSFLCLFMLFSAVIKDKLYFGEANVALLVGAILGPFAANAVDPNIWSHFDTVVLEFSRVVIIIQCFAVALELPKRYIHFHWKSLLWLVGPVVVWGWMVCTLLVWFMVPRLSFTQSMTIASCFNAIDPVMAATIVGNGRFARRVPAHLRNLLLAESASNDVTTSVCLGLSILLTRFPGTASELARSLFVYTILYQIFLAAGIGLTIGWAAGKALEYQEKNDSTDRESFLVFYLMVALVCIGLGSLLGIDDVLMAFCAGYNFDKTKWWRRKTEESHVSDAINLLLNLTYFVFLGSMIPWSSFNKPDLHISAWRLVAGTVLIFILRRLPVIMLLKGVIPDIKTWREAFFFGHFGPVGVGAIFSAALISSEPGKTGIAGNLLKPTPGDPMQISLWPVVTFVVLCSSIVHGSSIPLFKFAKHINTLTITMSYTAGNEDGPGWINRLPRITTPSSSQGRTLPDTGEYPPVSLPTVGIPGALLRRQIGEDSDSNTSHTSSVIPRRRRRRKWDSGIGTGGSVSEYV
jgi:sodium/hydrogen antiporter